MSLSALTARFQSRLLRFSQVVALLLLVFQVNAQAITVVDQGGCLQTTDVWTLAGNNGLSPSRNIYTTTAGNGNIPGRISWDAAQNRWRLQVDVQADGFTSGDDIYYSTSATAPNPPSGAGNWVTVTGPYSSCGPLTQISGSGTQVSAGFPTISSFSPTSGPAGTLVTINGTNLTGLTSVVLRGIPCNITPVSATQASFVVPAQASTGPVRLTTTGGNVLSSTFTVTRASASLTYVLRSSSFNGINVSSFSTPAFTDLDHDGLIDLLVGRETGEVSHYEQSAVNSTSFILRSNNLSGLMGHFNSLVSVTDIDGDGLLEMVVGTGAGNFKHYEQSAPNSTSFTQLSNDFNNVFSAGGLTFQIPHFTDIDGDGLLDLLVGDEFLSRYEQTTANGGTFNQLNNQNFGPTTDAGNGGAAACVTDLDGDGLLDLLVSRSNSQLFHYEQNSANSTAFTQVSTAFSGLNLSGYSAPAITDFDGDGLLDLILGGADGVLRHYEQAAPPVVTSDPVSRSVCSGSGTTFTVAATGASSFQWQVNTGSGFSNLNNTAPYSGVTSTTLTISNVAGFNGYQYRCVATGDGVSVNSNPATLTVNVLPTASLTNNGPLTCSQTSVSLMASGGNSYTLINPSGVVILTANGFAVSSNVSSPGSYSVRVGDVNGCVSTTSTSVISNTATITTSNPATNTVAINTPFSQTFTAMGGVSPYSFSIASGNPPTGLSLANTGVLSGTPTQGGSFTITVRGSDANGCSDLSPAYVLSVNATPTITGFNTLDNTVCAGSPITFTATVGNVSPPYAFTLSNGTIGTPTGTTMGNAGSPGSPAATFSQNLVASGSGTQTFTLTVSASGQSATATTSLTVTAAPSATIAYPGSPFLTSSGPVSVSQTGTAGGTYSNSPAGLSLNAGTGQITPVSSNPGNYTVTYALAASGGCAAFSTTAPVGIQGPQADLGITCTSGVTTAVPGGSVTYTITVRNDGPQAVTGARVLDTFPAILTATWTAIGAGGGMPGAISGSGNIDQTVNLPAGGSVTFTVSANISAGATGLLVNTATVTAPTGVTDPVPGNNSATDTDTLTPQADLSITCTDGRSSVQAGSAITYTITVSNAGPSNAPGARVVDVFPASLMGVIWTAVGAGGGMPGATSGSGNIDQTVNLPAGGSVTFTVNATLSSSATGTLANTATVTAPAGVTDPSPGNNSATDTDTITPGTPTIANFAASPSAVCVGSPITFTATIGNVTGSYSYTLTNGGSTSVAASSNNTAFSQNLTASGSGSQSFTLTVSTSGQITTAITSLTVNALPVAGLTNNGPLTCDQTSVTLTASGGNSYTFSAGATKVGTSNLATVNAPGTYLVSVGDVNGCVSTTSTTVMSSTATVSVSNPSVSTTTVGSVFSQPFTASGGSDPYSFSVASGSLPTGLNLATTGMLSGTPTQSGSFTITVRASDANGCAGTGATYTLTVNDATPTIADFAASPSAVCVGSSITFTATIGNVTGSYDFTLTNGVGTSIAGNSSNTAFGQNLTASGSGAQTFTLTVSTNGQLATATASVTVNALPDATFMGLPGSVCLDAGPATLTPTTPGGSFAGSGISGSSFSAASAGAGGPYPVTYTVSRQGCLNTSVQSVTVKPLPAAPAIATQTGQFYPGGVSSLTIARNVGNVILTVSGCAGGTITWAGGNSSTLAVSTVNTGVQTFTATCTTNGCTSPAAVATLTVVPTTLSVLSRDPDNGQLTSNTIKPYFQLQNAGNQPIVYDQISVRYWLTAEEFAPLAFQTGYVALGSNNLRIRYVPLDQPRQGAFGYVEYSFLGSAGSLGAGSNSGEIQNSFVKQTYSPFNQADDYSYLNQGNYAPNARMTAYIGNTIVWGQEPGLVAPQSRLRVYTQQENGPNANSISTTLNLRNEGNLPVAYGAVTVRYYFTSEGTSPLNVNFNYAQPGRDNVIARFVRLNPALAGADTYLELSFNGGLGSLSPLSSTGNLQYQIVKSDYSYFSMSDDHSYQGTGGLVANDRVVVYVDGVRVAGTEPGSGARLGTQEPDMLRVRVVGNPVSGPEVSVEVTGAEGQPLRLHVTDITGRLVSERSIERAGLVERQTVPVDGQGAGLLFLRVSTPTQSQTVKLLNAH